MDKQNLKTEEERRARAKKKALRLVVHVRHAELQLLHALSSHPGVGSDCHPPLQSVLAGWLAVEILAGKTCHATSAASLSRRRPKSKKREKQQQEQTWKPFVSPRCSAMRWNLLLVVVVVTSTNSCCSCLLYPSLRECNAARCRQMQPSICPPAPSLQKGHYAASSNKSRKQLFRSTVWGIRSCMPLPAAAAACLLVSSFLSLGGASTRCGVQMSTRQSGMGVLGQTDSKRGGGGGSGCSHVAGPKQRCHFPGKDGRWRLSLYESTEMIATVLRLLLQWSLSLAVTLGG